MDRKKNIPAKDKSNLTHAMNVHGKHGKMNFHSKDKKQPLEALFE